MLAIIRFITRLIIYTTTLLAMFECVGSAIIYLDDSISSNSGPVDYRENIEHIWNTSISFRSKRDQSRLVTSYAFSQNDIQMLVDEHNRVRRLVPAIDMRLIRWDETLASSAQAHANECTFAHSTNRRNVIGENIWASVFSTYEKAIQIWFNEGYDKSCGCTNYYKHCCGHYTQVAWASTSKVGCGYAKCNNILYAPKYHYILVCQYSPSGNMQYPSNGQMVNRPAFTYTKDGDAACSGCAQGYKCDNGLCTW